MRHDSFKVVFWALAQYKSQDMDFKRIQIGLLLGALFAIPAYAQSPSSTTQATNTAQAANAPEDNSGSLGEHRQKFEEETACASTRHHRGRSCEEEGPFPKMEMDDDDNSADIIVAIVKYKSTHSPEETEDAVRSWYDRYNDMLDAALRDNKQTMQRNQIVGENGYYGCRTPENYQACQQQAIAQQRIARSDQADTADNADDFTHSARTPRNSQRFT